MAAETKEGDEDYASLTKEEVLARWNSTSNNRKRDGIVKIMKKNGWFPDEYMKQWDESIGAYPDYDDPEFLQKLLAKREFAESFQASWDPANDPCGSITKFEITPVQRFVANLMSPRTPYMSALLYHGVGVGKTCSAIQITEAWLDSFPEDKVIIIAPRTIQTGFLTTIFDSTEKRLTIGTQENEPNKAMGCTGDTYMEMTGTLLERDREKIKRRVDKAIKNRYDIYGYLQFANYIKRIMKRYEQIADEDVREIAIKKEIRRVFSGKLMIIDEAHNLRDITGQADAVGKDEDVDEPGGADAKEDMVGGKQMTPYLSKVLEYAQGMKLVLMTATPMYNTYREIIFILNVLLKNDKKALLIESDIFDKQGNMLEGATERLGAIASRYVSFMRGENPKSFPVRIKPMDVPVIPVLDYPTLNPRNHTIAASEKEYVSHLPIVKVDLPEDGDNYKASVAFMGEIGSDEGTGYERGISSQELSISIQAGNFIPPASDSMMEETLENYRSRMKAGEGLLRVMDRMSGPPVQYKAKEGRNAKWLSLENLGNYAPKFVFLIKRLATCEGVAFVYSRFVDAGALPLALSLEANGYKCYNRKVGFLSEGVQDGKGGQCALCPSRELNHGAGAAGSKNHAFKQAYYGLLTGDRTLSADNPATIASEQLLGNKDGELMKVIIGSQVASEGVDLRFVREVHVLDSWYHLNKTEQVIGRAIRFCSHSALDKLKRNTTIYLYAAYFGDLENETADLYCYRLAYKKALQVGRVSRALKIRAIDCNLNHDAIIIANQPLIAQVDSQRRPREDVNINDVGFTAICDWLKSCDYECRPKIAIDIASADDGSYSEYAVQWRESQLKERLRSIFTDTLFVELAEMDGLFYDVPQIARTEFLSSIVDNKGFQVKHKTLTGYIRFCNNYFVFQPNVYTDVTIPLAIRMATFPVRRDEFAPKFLERIPIPLIEAAPVESAFSLGAIWNAFREWIDRLVQSSEWIEEPTIVKTRITDMSRGDSKAKERYETAVLMIQWFHIAAQDTRVGKLNLSRVLLEYIWDNWFTFTEQRILRDEQMLMDGLVKIGSRTIERSYNYETNQNEYFIGEDKAPGLLVNDIQEREKEQETLFRTQRAPWKTGSYYGFLIAKDGNLTFKSNTVPEAGKKWNPGAACNIVSVSSRKYPALEALGAILVAAGEHSFDLKFEIIRSSRKLDAFECCIIMELVLRYMDIKRVKDERWFYRPVIAKMLGHLGSISKDIVVEVAPIEKKPRKLRAKKADAEKAEGSDGDAEGEKKPKKSRRKLEDSAANPVIIPGRKVRRQLVVSKAKEPTSALDGPSISERGPSAKEGPPPSELDILLGIAKRPRTLRRRTLITGPSAATATAASSTEAEAGAAGAGAAAVGAAGAATESVKPSRTKLISRNPSTVSVVKARSNLDELLGIGESPIVPQLSRGVLSPVVEGSSESASVIAEQQPQSVVAEQQPQSVVAEQQPQSVVAAEDQSSVKTVSVPPVRSSNKTVEVTKADE